MNNQTKHYEPIADTRIVEIKNENSGVLGMAAKAENIRNIFPVSFRKFLRKFVPHDSYSKQLLMADPFYYCKTEPSYKSEFNITVGIIADIKLKHKYPIAACLDLGVYYKLIDITGDDWYERIKSSNCDFFVVHPTMDLSFRKRMYEDRIRVMVEQMKIDVYPELESLWFYESKYRMYYWLASHNFPTMKCWIFYNARKALDFCSNVDLPIVFKSDLGSGASGVKIFSDRDKLLKFVKSHFKNGFCRRDNDPRDREWGSVMFQEYIADAREWRMIRIGDSYFGYEKIKVGDFHSGSHKWAYSRPDDRLLDLLKQVTDAGNFSSMDLDIFIDKQGKFYINEMQAVFGMGNPYEMCVIDDKPGMMSFNKKTGKWDFLAGDFCQNYMWNLRLHYLLKNRGIHTNAFGADV